MLSKLPLMFSAKFQNWAQKKPQIIEAMQKAFVKGIKMNTSTNDGNDA